MLIKKIALPIAALAMTALVGCGSDSSSNSAPANGGTIDQLPASVDKFFDVEKYTCTETVNKCKTVAIKGQTEPAQCAGNNTWGMVMLGKPVAGCTSVPDPVDPADPSTDPEPSTDPVVGPTPVSGTVACQDAAGMGCSEGPASYASECDTSDGEVLLDACPAGGTLCEIPGAPSDIKVYMYGASAADNCELMKALAAGAM